MFSHSGNWLLLLSLLVQLGKTTSTYYPYIPGSGSGCVSLITSNSNVKFSASSSSVGPGFPVLNSTDVWCAGDINNEEYLMVDLGDEMFVDQVSVQGKPGTNKSVAQFYVNTSTDGIHFVYNRDESGYQDFFGSLFNGDEVTTSNFNDPQQARYILFNPREPLMPDNNLCMRVDVASCRNDPTPIHGQWSDWSSWSACSPQCYGQGLGIRSRHRNCTNPAPAFGGKPCPNGLYSEDHYCPNNCPVHGQWGHWTTWSSCSKTCGKGTKTRTRHCNNPVPHRGGANCVGTALEKKECVNSKCTIDGNWTQWSHWSACSLTCGGGIRSRSRNCTDPPPRNGGNPCVGEKSEQQPCNTQSCPVHGQWGHWTTWSSCSKTCGKGTKTRTRHCNNPVPHRGGANCVGTALEKKECVNSKCTIDGNWTQWSHWSACSLTCGGGIRSRSRNCTDPPPRHGGNPCVGERSQQQPCNTQSCPVHGQWGHWTTWSSCSKTCGKGTKTRTRHCNNPVPHRGGANCVGTALEKKECVNSKCTIDGNWTQWSHWSACSLTCGGGIRSRSRNCTDPPPRHGGKLCVGQGSEKQPCNTQSCPVDGGWTDWTPWSICSVTCGNGTQSRTRKCTKPPPSHIGAGCAGYPSAVRPCNLGACPVDGGLSNWTPWSACSKPCGGGTSVRTRKCDTPPPSPGGNPCTGKRFESKDCNVNVCPVDGGWSRWTSWTVCNKTCGGGQQFRTRRCDSPAPSNSGNPCPGPKTENRACNDFTCSVDGKWSPWTNFSQCSVTCGKGKQIRTRTCTDPPPTGGGVDCPGLALETIDCNDGPCVASGYAQWGQWSTCSKTCRYLGVAGTRKRTRICDIPDLGCDGPEVEVRECNTVDCEGCQEKLSLNDTNYSASSSAIQPARFARLDTSNPGLSRRAWCADPRVAGSYVQIDLGERVEVYQIATKGQEDGSPSWVTRYFLSISEDGSSFFNYTQGGQTKVFSGNTDSSSVVFNKLNATTPVRYVRFYPISFNEQPCMQASVFGCSSVIIPPTESFVAGDDDAGQGILIALWILAGILTFLLLLACLYYCCWHVCCNRGKKRKGLAAFRDTSSEDGYLIEEDGNKAWRGPAAAMAPTVPRVKTPEDEVQEVSIEMTDDVKPLGVIQFGIETEETKDKHVTADEVHSETPKYSQEVGQIKSGAEMLTMSSTDTGYRSTERRRHKSETAAPIGDAGATSAEWSYRTEQRQSSAFDNGAYMRSQEFVAEQTGPSQTRVQGQELKRSKSADELSTSNYAMCEQRRGSSQQVVRGEMGRDGYMRMKETRQESVDVTDGGIQMGTIDVAIGGIGTPDTRRGSSQLYGMEEQEMSFSADNGGRNVYYLDDGGYRTEEWYTRGGRAPGQLRNEGFREIHVEHQPIYTEIQPDSERFRHSRII